MSRERDREMNVLLVDNELKIIDHILESTNWQIEVLITISEKTKYTKNPRIKKIYTQENFYKNRDLSGFDYEDLEHLWHAQLKVEDCYGRFVEDYQMAKWNYYRGYALVKQIFDNHQLDFVIVKGMNHGHTWDRLITDYASYKKIVSYNIEVMLQYTRIVYNNYTCKMVEAGNKGKVSIGKSLFYEEDFGKAKVVKKDFWSWIYKISYRIFGSLGTDIAKCVRYRDLGEDLLGVSILERMKQWRKIEKCKRYVDSISVKPNQKRKYIFFALHFEPEATVAGRAIMESQIAAIQMIASCLPKEWVVYVKEHPFQYMVNKSNYYGYLYGVGVFKTRRFYQEIASIDKVKFIKRETGSKEILKNCQAVATLNGTVAAEAIAYGKPVMLFAAERTVFEVAKGFYVVHSYEECKNFIKKIVAHDAVSYDDFKEICQKYIIDFSDESRGFRQAIEAIKAEIHTQG